MQIICIDTLQYLFSSPQHTFVKTFDPVAILVSMLQRTSEQLHQLNSMNYQWMHNLPMGASNYNTEVHIMDHGCS